MNRLIWSFPPWDYKPSQLMQGKKQQTVVFVKVVIIPHISFTEIFYMGRVLQNGCHGNMPKVRINNFYTKCCANKFC